MNTPSKSLTSIIMLNSRSVTPSAAETDHIELNTRFLSVGEGRVAYDDTGGSGPLILAIPGMGDLRSEYRALQPLLQQAGYRIVTMDIRGHGETTARWNDYSAHAISRDALALISHLSAGPVVILGNSFAAGSALWAAHDAPEHVRAVVLLGPVVRDLQSSWFANQKPADHKHARAALAANLKQPGRMEALRTMISLSKADTASIVTQNRVPAMVVMGTKEPGGLAARATI